MKVYHVLTHFMPAQTAGTEMYVYALQKRLQQLGYTGGVIIPFIEQKNDFQYVFNGVSVYGYPQEYSTYDQVVKGILPPSGLQAFSDLLDRLQPDLLHFHELSGSHGVTVFHMQVAKQKKIPIIFTMHLVGYVCPAGTLMQNNNRPCKGLIDEYHCARCTFIHQQVPAIISGLYAGLSAFLRKAGVSIYSLKGPVAGLLGRSERIVLHRERLKQISECCDIIVTLNKWYANMLERNGVPSHKIKIVEQGLPFCSHKCSENVMLQHPDYPLRLVFVGRIFRAKGLHLLLSALEDIPLGAYKLDIYGPANDEEYIGLCRKMIGDNASIRFCGTIPPGQTVSYLENYHLLILPSVVTEMAPLVIQEAFAAGVPVIASDVYGSAAHIHHGENGLLFNFNNSVSLRKQIQACIENPELVKGLAANIKPPVDFSEVASAYTKLYKKTISDL